MVASTLGSILPSRAVASFRRGNNRRPRIREGERETEMGEKIRVYFDKEGRSKQGRQKDSKENKDIIMIRKFLNFIIHHLYFVF